MKNLDFSHISRVIIVGSVAYDEIMDFPGQFADYIHPEKIHTLSVSFGIDRLTKQLGGVATNIAYGLRLTHPDLQVSVASGVGQDGREFEEFFKRHRIDTSLLVSDKALYCATGKVITDRHNNQIWGFYYGACESAKAIDYDQIDPKTSCVIISSTHTAAFIVAQDACIRRGIPYIYDPGMVMTFMDVEILKTGIQHASIVIANDYEVGHITKATGITVDAMVQAGTTVITTLGKDGVEYRDGTITKTVGAYPQTAVKDPTGAGDAFRGGFVGSMIAGRPLQESLAAGCALASFAIESYGTVNHAPSSKELSARRKVIAP